MPFIDYNVNGLFPVHFLECLQLNQLQSLSGTVEASLVTPVRLWYAHEGRMLKRTGGSGYVMVKVGERRVPD